ncbi:MAG: hypothetical protein D6785_02605 [Planctomycetota bacterium]|nr:MAG: hypothetical protein D6785_02605 [Planctomycetota bacterium]
MMRGVKKIQIQRKSFSPRKSTQFFSFLTCFLAIMLCLGCGKNGMSGDFYSGADSSSGAISIPQNMKPAPTIEITEPGRGKYFTNTDTTVTVKGKVQDPKYAITSLKVAGTSLAVPQNGQFSTQVNLKPGLNILWATAKNSEGGRSISVVSVLQGDYRKDTLLIPNAAWVQVSQKGLEKVKQKTLPMLTTLDVEQSLRNLNPLYSGSIPLVGSANVDLQILKYTNPDILFKLNQGYMDVTVTLSNLDVKAKAYGKIFGISYSLIGNTGASKVTLSAKVYLSVQNGKLNASFQNTNVLLEGFYFTFPNSNFLNFFAKLAKNIIKKKIIQAVKSTIEQKLPGFLSDMFNNLKKPITKKILGKDLEMTFVPQNANITPSAISVQMDSNVRVIGASSLFQAPGSFYTPSYPPTLTIGATSDFTASLNDDYLNRVLYTAWQAGLLEMTIDDAFLSKMSSSSSSFTSSIKLNGGLILKFYPELASHINNTDPLSLEIKAFLPPIVQMAGNPDLLKASAGEIEIGFIIHQGALKRTVMKVRAHISMTVSASVSNGQLSIQFIGRPSVFGDVTEEPMMDIDESKVELLLNVVVPIMMPQLLKSIQGIQLPTLLGISIGQVTMQQDGPSGDFLTLTGSLKTQ